MHIVLGKLIDIANEQKKLHGLFLSKFYLKLNKNHKYLLKQINYVHYIIYLLFYRLELRNMFDQEIVDNSYQYAFNTQNNV